MNIFFKRFRTVVLVLSCVLLSASIPYFADYGLTKAEPIGKFLNAKFPGLAQNEITYIPVFPNINFFSPLTFSEVPAGGRIIVGQRNGIIFWFDNEPDVRNKQIVIDLSNKVGVVGDGGFLGLAIHPNFGDSDANYIYTYYTTKDANGNNFPNKALPMGCDAEEYFGNFLILSRYTVNPNTLEADSAF